jgi:endonuclease/exonuclease/phosphatase family metal-dependent hydrolase
MHIPVKVMSFNIHHGADSEGSYDLGRTAEVIRQSGAELIGLQEVDRYFSNRSRLEDTIGRLAAMLGMHYAYGANLDRPPAKPGMPRNQYGTAVLSKYPIMASHNHLLTSFGKEQRGLLETLIDINGIPVYFYSTHLGLDQEQRETQTNEILSIMGQNEGPQIVVGDFNARPHSPEMRKLTALFQEPWASLPEAYTIASNRPYAKIDYIWANEQLLLGDPADAVVMNVQASDHFPIISSLIVKRELVGRRIQETAAMNGAAMQAAAQE